MRIYFVLAILWLAFSGLLIFFFTKEKSSETFNEVGPSQEITLLPSDTPLPAKPVNKFFPNKNTNQVDDEAEQQDSELLNPLIKSQPDILKYETAAHNNVIEWDIPLEITPENKIQPTLSARITQTIDKPAKRQNEYEKKLWALLGEQNFPGLQNALATVKQTEPTYQVPSEIKNFLAEWQIQQRLQRVFDDKDWQAMIAIEQQYPEKFNCQRIDYLWALADSYIDLNDFTQAFTIYLRIIEQCDNDEHRLVTLQKADDHNMPLEQLKVLFGRAEEYIMNATIKKQMFDFRYYCNTRAFFVAFDNEDYAAATMIAQAISPEILARKDTDIASALGWTLFKQQEYVAAEYWFEQAWHWRTDDDNANAVVLTYLKQGKYQQAEIFMRKLDGLDVRLKQHLWDILVTSANRFYQQEKYEFCLLKLKEAEKFFLLDQDYQKMQAWSYFNLAMYAEAAKLFEQLYRNKPDEETAKGFFYSHLALGEKRTIESVAVQVAGPVVELWNEHLSQRDFSRKLYLLAQQRSPGMFASLQNIDSPHVTGGVGYLHRRGTEGLNQLQLWRLPMSDVAVVQQGIHQWRLQIDNIRLSSGRLAPYAPIGRMPNDRQSYLFAQDRWLNAGLEPQLHYYREGWTSFFFSLGSTPLDALVTSKPTWQLGMLQQTTKGYWRLSLSEQSVKNSMLSYVGMQDPYTGDRWGRVLKTALQLSDVRQLSSDTHLYSQVAVARLKGQQVDSNTSISVLAFLSRRDAMSDRFSLNYGPYVSYLHYRENLSQFTFGHGGYFSPQNWFELGGQLDYITSANKSWLIKANFQLSGAWFKEAKSPFFPLSPDDRYYREDDKTELGFAFSLMGVKKVTARWQVGGGFHWQKNSSFDQTAALAFARWYFADRHLPLSIDLPHAMLQRLAF